MPVVQSPKLAQTAIVLLAHNASAVPRGLTQHQTLQSIVDRGGLPAWIAAADPTNGGSDVAEKALWAIATWLSLDNVASNALFVRSGGLVALLAATNGAASTQESARFARLSLGKLLCTVGDELTARISLLSAHVAEKGAAEVVAVWEKMSA